MGVIRLKKDFRRSIEKMATDKISHHRTSVELVGINSKYIYGHIVVFFET